MRVVVLFKNYVRGTGEIIQGVGHLPYTRSTWEQFLALMWSLSIVEGLLKTKKKKMISARKIKSKGLGLIFYMWETWI